MFFQGLRSRAAPSQAALTVTVLLTFASCPLHGQVVFRCKNVAGEVVFSDKSCTGDLSAANVLPLVDSDSSQRKAEHDAIVSRDKALAAQVEASRMAREQAQISAANQQLQANKAVNDRYEQERSKQNAATVSSPGVTQVTPVGTFPTSQ